MKNKMLVKYRESVSEAQTESKLTCDSEDMCYKGTFPKLRFAGLIV